MFITDIRSSNREGTHLVMSLCLAPGNTKTYVIVAIALLVSLALVLDQNVKAGPPEYERYVHTFVSSTINWTYMEKPLFAVTINESQVDIGQNWSIVCPLEASHSYHVYCYGRWVNTNSTPKTDYDVYVYNPLGELEGYHTEAAGLPEHLGTTTSDPTFTPRHSGNYTFVVSNDPRESNGAEQATFMIIESAECNEWHERYIEGKDASDEPLFNTSWAYDFWTEKAYVEVFVDVPDSLDMYEARLYLMSDNRTVNRTVLNEVPLAWEPGLRGEHNSTLGGYSLESREYRGVAYASCEQYGQDMFLNFNASRVGNGLYHLVLIGEAGKGTVKFLVKTEFGTAALLPSVVPGRVYPQNETIVAYVTNGTNLTSASLYYSSDGWKNVSAVNMEIVEGRTCNATIPGQATGYSVAFKVEVTDILRNLLGANGSYTVKYASTISLSAERETITAGESIKVNGFMTPGAKGKSVTVIFSAQNTSKEVIAYTDADGAFAASLQTENITTWEIAARFDGDSTTYSSLSTYLTVKVEEPTFLAKYSLYLGGGIGTIIGFAGLVVYLKKFRQ